MTEKQRIKRQSRRKTKGFWRKLKNDHMKWMVERDKYCLSYVRKWLRSEGIKKAGVVALLLSSAISAYSYGDDQAFDQIMAGNLVFAVPFFAGFLGDAGTNITDWVGHLAGTNIDWSAYSPTSSHSTMAAFETAAEGASAGDVITLNNGTFGGATINGANGASGNPIVLKATNPGTWGSRNAIISGGSFRIEDCSYVICGGFKFSANGNFGVGMRGNGAGNRFVDCEVDGSGTTGVGSSTFFEIGEGCDSCQVDHIYFTNNSGAFHVTNNTNPRTFALGVVIEYCTINQGTGTSDETVKAGGFACWTVADTTGSHFRYNHMLNGCACCDMKWGGWRFHHNAFIDSAEEAIRLRTGKEFDAIYSNLFDGCQRCVRITGHNQVFVNNVCHDITEWVLSGRPGDAANEVDNDDPGYTPGSYGRCINCLMAQNTCYDCGGNSHAVVELGDDGVASGTVEPDGTWIRNNTFVINTHIPSKIIHLKNGTTNTLVDGNQFDIGATDDGSTFEAGWTDSNRVDGANSFTGAYTHIPIESSNTVDQGVVFTWNATADSSFSGSFSSGNGVEYQGNQRNAGGSPDIGALEYQPGGVSSNLMMANNQSNSL